jgi:translation initiation factor 1 (eIF-1/SUI1)
MDESSQDGFNIEIAEIKRLVKEFKERFAAGTTSTDDFMTISELELMWGELQNRTNNIYSDMIRKLMSEVDESALIRKKKDTTNSKG